MKQRLKLTLTITIQWNVLIQHAQIWSIFWMELISQYAEISAPRNWILPVIIDNEVFYTPIKQIFNHTIALKIKA